MAKPDSQVKAGKCRSSWGELGGQRPHPQLHQCGEDRGHGGRHVCDLLTDGGVCGETD